MYMYRRPAPAIVPVISLLTLFELCIFRCCTSQSINITAQRASAMYILMRFGARYISGVNTYPRITPVHLAHTGNWYPFHEKLLSCLWWHPNLAPNFINLSHILSFLSKVFPTVSTLPVLLSCSVSGRAKAAK